MLPKTNNPAKVIIDILNAKSDKVAHMHKIALLNYPQSLQSAIFGLQEMFMLANRFAEEDLFTVEILQETDLPPDPHFFAIIVPPSLSGGYYKSPSPDVTHWLQTAHQNTTVLCSACAGAFILAASGLLAGRQVTTHWGLSDDLKQTYPDIHLDSDKILINAGDIITAGGIMSWVDLGLELVAQVAGPLLMRQVGKTLVVDTAPREQRFYRSFQPNRKHADTAILAVQNHLQTHFDTNLTITEMANMAGLGERTFLRRFTKACNHTPTQYVQRLRIQKACDLLESTVQSVETIAYHIGYEDISAFRKVFFKIIGLTPRDFRNRFGEGPD